MARIALLQCELEHRHQAPHLAMCLYARDLRKDGHSVRCALVHPTGLEQAARSLSGELDLLVMDSIFPFAMARFLGEQVGARTLVGGHAALQHALRGPCDLAIVGPGRAALRSVARCLDEGGRLQEVPGLWFRGDDGVLDCCPGASAPRLEAELLPFDPELDWEYFGPPRAPESNLRVPSVVAELGCVWNRSILRDAGPYASVKPRLPDLPLSERAQAVLRSDFVEREGGCSFCVLRYMPPTRLSLQRNLASLAMQVRVLLERGARGVSLQTEHPLPALLPLLEHLESEGLTQRLDELHLRTIPWLLLEHRQALEDGIEKARGLGLRLVLSQVGFEAFDAEGLAVYHKGLSPERNRAAARLLGELEALQPQTFVGTAGHGFVPFHPWTTPGALRTNLEACRADAPWLLRHLHPSRRIELYDEWSPLFWKAQDEGLLVEAPDSFGWDWQFADAGTGEVAAASGAILAGRPGQSPPPADVILEAVLDIFEAERSPEARRAAYIALRDSSS